MIILLTLIILPKERLFSQNYNCLTEDNTVVNLQVNADCNPLIDPNHTSTLPVFTVKMHIHYIANPISGINFYDGELGDWNTMNGTQNTFNLIYHVKPYLEQPYPNPIGLADYLDDTRIRFEVTPNYKDGVYYWSSMQEYQQNYIPTPEILDIRMIDNWDSTIPVSEMIIKGSACSIGNDCNWINIYNWQTSEALGGPAHYWNEAQNLKHEVFHILGLSHTFSYFNECRNVDIDQPLENNGNLPWESGSQNTMGYNVCQCAISPCQWSHIYSNTYDDHFSFVEIDCGEEYSDIIINQNTVWNQKVLAMGNIIVNEGTSLTINCEVELNDKSSIIVKEGAKLIIDGGKLTTLTQCNVNKWVGIKAYGGNQDYDVKIINESVIENTKEAAISFFAPEPWPEIKDYGNGILIADNSTFNNVHRLSSMMAWSPSFNPSSITNCTQNGGRWGITNWNCYNVEVKDNVFNDIEYECIVTHSGQFELENNEFHSKRSDVLFANVSEIFGSNTINNSFYGSNDGIFSWGGGLGLNLIQENTFNNNRFGVWMDGNNTFVIDDNIFNTINNYSAVSINNGYHANNISNNTINSEAAGLIALGYNPGYNFYLNCFNTTISNVTIYNEISPIVSASAGMAADNCFTHQGNIFSNVSDINGNPDPFVYNESDGEFIDCLKAVKAHPNVSRNTIDVSPLNPCDEEGSEEDNVYNICNPEPTLSATSNAINQIYLDIVDINNDPNLTDIEKDALVESLINTCMKKVLKIRFSIYLNIGQYQNARASLSLFAEEEDTKIDIYTTYIFEHNLEEAESYISQITNESSSLAFIDFKAIQQFYLNKLKYGPYYEVNDTDKSTIKAIAEKSHVYSGYAKALHYMLTNEIIMSELPKRNKEVKARSGSISQSTNLTSISVFPNPANNNLRVSCSEEAAVITIIDLTGKIILQQPCSGDKTINTSYFKDGIYIIKMVATKDNVTLYQNKIIIQH